MWEFCRFGMHKQKSLKKIVDSTDAKHAYKINALLLFRQHGDHPYLKEACKVERLPVCVEKMSGKGCRY